MQKPSTSSVDQPRSASQLRTACLSSGGTLYRRHVTPSHTTPIVTGPQQYSYMPQGVPSHVLEADPSHSQPHLRLSRAATTQARRHPRRAAPIAADAPPLQCVRLSTGARRCLERSMSLARAAARSRRSDHPQHPSRLEPRRPPSRRYTCADRQAARSCGRHGQHRSHKQPPSRARLEITRPVRRRPLARGHVAPRLDGRLPKLTALSYLGLAPPPHSPP